MFLLYCLLLLVGPVVGSHYRGGSMSYTIPNISNNMTTNGQEIAVRITQRHSWRRSAHSCNNTDPNSGDMIGEGFLQSNQSINGYSKALPMVGGLVRCTDYSEELDYSSGENSTIMMLPRNQTIEYSYEGCCWIPLLPPDSDSNWSLKFIINTKQRLDGTLNNSPKTAMNPIVQVEIGKVHTIRIPMADSDGDPIRCRWGNSTQECGSICPPKGPLRSNPCELTYNASQLGYQAVALVIEDFDSNNNVLSAIPLQFLIHIVNITAPATNGSNCTELPIYVGEWAPDSCIGVQSNTTINTRIQIRIPCEDTQITLEDILTISPAGLIKGEIINNSSDPNLYTMPIEWTPQPDQSGIQQLCVTPLDSQRRTGSQVCFTFQVDISPPEFILLTPAGLVSAGQSSWTIETDRNIIKPRRSNRIYIRFFKRSTNQEIHRIDVTTDVNVIYQQRQITFSTTGYTWEQNEEYYILLDNGIAILNESCGVESVQITDPYAWVFRVETYDTTTFIDKSTSVTQQLFSTTTEPISSSTSQPTTSSSSSSTFSTTVSSITPDLSTTSSSRPACPQWFTFNTISNESTSINQPNFTFCFNVNVTLADVTISANTWVSCMLWKLSGAADPLIELYTEPGDRFLAQNDDGSSLAFQNCYAAVLSYRLKKGDYRVIIRSPKCSYGKFELRLSAEIDRNLK